MSYDSIRYLFLARLSSVITMCKNYFYDATSLFSSET